MTSLKIFLCHPVYARTLAGIILLLTVLCFSFPLMAEERKPVDPCIAKLQDPSLKNINCVLDFNLDAKTRKDLDGTTGGVFKDATCKVKLSLGREELFTALLNEKVLEVPRQPVACQILTNGKPMLTKFTMAPRVWFAKGKAVQLKPGMSKLDGMPEILSVLLTSWVNTSKTIESAMLHEVNAILKSGLPS